MSLLNNVTRDCPSFASCWLCLLLNTNNGATTVINIILKISVCVFVDLHLVFTPFDYRTWHDNWWTYDLRPVCGILITYRQPGLSLTLQYLHRVPKKTCDYIFYNIFNNNCPITIIFGTVSSKSMCYRKMVSFPTSPI